MPKISISIIVVAYPPCKPKKWKQTESWTEKIANTTYEWNQNNEKKQSLLDYNFWSSFCLKNHSVIKQLKQMQNRSPNLTKAL